MMALLAPYRRMPVLLAFALATCGAVVVSLAATVAGVFTISKILDHLEQSGPGAGVFLVTAIPNIIVPTFIAALTFLVHTYRQTSWKTPTFAFLVGVLATWIWIGSIDFTFTPIVLGTGALTWIVSCLMLRRKGVPETQHVL